MKWVSNYLCTIFRHCVSCDHLWFFVLRILIWIHPIWEVFLQPLSHNWSLQVALHGQMRCLNPPYPAWTMSSSVVTAIYKLWLVYLFVILNFRGSLTQQKLRSIWLQQAYHDTKKQSSYWTRTNQIAKVKAPSKSVVRICTMESDTLYRIRIAIWMHEIIPTD